jgi:hypothetical protein
MFTVLEITLLAFVLNIPFGYFRKKAGKFSVKWWLYIHIPVPLVIAVRIALQADYIYIPVFILAAVAGQFLGGKLSFNR